MSQINKCDRCGAENTNEHGMSKLSFYLENAVTIKYDLCSKCINELAYMIKDWVEKENAKRK